jgi:hypothetical protein
MTSFVYTISCTCTEKKDPMCKIHSYPITVRITKKGFVPVEALFGTRFLKHRARQQKTEGESRKLSE